MKQTTLTTTTLALYLAFTLIGCADGGFTAATVTDSLSSSQGQDGNSGGTTPPSPPAMSPELQNLNMKGRIAGGSYDQSLAVDLNKQTGQVLFYIPMTGLQGLQITELEVPTTKGITLGLDTTSDGTRVLAVRVPAKYLLRGVQSLPAGRLPSGDILPQIPGGELPTTAIAITRNGEARLHLYLGVEVIGIYVETKFDPYIRLTLPIKNEAGTRTLGYFSLVPEKPGYRGGFFMSMQLPRDFSRILDNHFGSL